MTHDEYLDKAREMDIDDIARMLEANDMLYATTQKYSDALWLIITAHDMSGGNLSLGEAAKIARRAMGENPQTTP